MLSWAPWRSGTGPGPASWGHRISGTGTLLLADCAGRRHSCPMRMTLTLPKPPGSPGSLQPPGPSPVSKVHKVLAGVVVVLSVAGAGIIHGGDGIVRRLSPGATRTAQTQAASPDASASTPSEDAWQRAWRLSGENVEAGGVFVTSDTLLVVGGQPEGTVTAYDITGPEPVRRWGAPAQAHGIRKQTLTTTTWGGRILVGDQAYDPYTGSSITVPWSNAHIVTTVADLALTYDSRSETYTAWDLNGGDPRQRWSRSAPGTWLLSHDHVSGDTRTGYLLITVRDHLSQHSRQLLSLADGSLHLLGDPLQSFSEYLPAADGWVVLDSAVCSSTCSMMTLGPDGQVLSGPTAFTRELWYSLLRAKEGLPTLEQYRRAYLDNDTSWADLVLTTDRGSSPSLNGSPLRLEGDCPITRQIFDDRYLESQDGSTVLLLNPWLDKLGEAVINLSNGTIAEMPSYLIRSDPGSSHVEIARADLIITVKDGEVVAYRPRA